MSFGNMLDLDRGIFLKNPEGLQYKSLSSYMSKLLSMQDNLLKASAAELLRTDTLRLTTKELHEQDRKSTRLNSSHPRLSRMPSSA